MQTHTSLQVKRQKFSIPVFEQKGEFFHDNDQSVFICISLVVPPFEVYEVWVQLYEEEERAVAVGNTFPLSV